MRDGGGASFRKKLDLRAPYAGALVKFSVKIKTWDHSDLRDS